MGYILTMNSATETAAAETHTRCDRCAGTGAVECFRHVAGGECFECSGLGYVEAEIVRARSAEYTRRYEASLPAHKMITVLGEPAMVTTWGGDWFKVETCDGWIAINAHAARMGVVAVTEVSDGQIRRQAEAVEDIRAALKGKRA